ncbi:hypothetical protein ONZ43_g680 [Nemania bipapillata]|uniref:Uncharacterized protein n=1 Tax=Nemania bipapillata TaxID=110536 RepID=A0ACC2J760_9PEZI|nr:hypothetical protein ONZ43_g680 [Nemania bipapillata]
MPRVIFRGNGLPNIRLVLYPEPVPSSWNWIRKMTPKFWDGSKKTFDVYCDNGESPDLPVTAILHMGMLDQPGVSFRLEKNGYKKGYKLPDIDGREPDDDDLNGGGMWEDVPDMLSTDLDVKFIHEKVTGNIEGANIDIAEDHERFLCGYEYFTSLVAAYKRKEKRNLLFLHTPIEHDSKDIEHGVRIVVKIVESMIEDIERQRSLSDVPFSK